MISLTYKDLTQDVERSVLAEELKMSCTNPFNDYLNRALAEFWMPERK